MKATSVIVPSPTPRPSNFLNRRSLRHALCLGVLGLILWPRPAAAVPAGAIWLSGAEIQALPYEAVGYSGVNIDTTTKHSGAASFAIVGKGLGAGFSTPTWGSPVTSGTAYISAWVYIGSNACPLGCSGTPFMLARAGGNAVASFRYDQSSSSVTLFGATAQIGTGYTITTNAWHLYEMKISIDASTTADDIVEGRIDGAVRSGQTTNTVDTGTNPVNNLRFVTPNISNSDGDPVRVDDIIVTSDDYVGMDGHVIMRTADGPGVYGSGSSVVAFNGCSSYASCWSDVPPSSTTFANDGTGSNQNGIKFLATIADFDAGADAMTAADTLFGCRGTWTIAKGPNGVNRNWEMLRRMDSTATEINIPSSGALNLTTSFDRWDDLECTLTNCGPWGFCSTPPCTGDVDAVELGGYRNSNAQAKVEEIGDVYVSCAYRRLPVTGPCSDYSPPPTQCDPPVRCNGRVLDIAATQAVLSSLDLGWTGIGHDSASFTTETRLSAVLGQCEHTTPPCGVCALSGPVPNVNADAGVINNQRCTSNTATKCSSNADCTGAGNVCAFYVGSYLPSPPNGLNLCIGTRVAAPMGGAVDLDTGAATLAMGLTTTFYFAATDGFVCPRCVGDATANDGVKGGTCSTGANAGLPCDVNGEGSSALGPTSLDCPPSTVASTLANSIDAGTDPQTVTLSTASPNCSASGFTGDKCFCDTCNNAAAAPCATNADCVAVGATVCGGKRCQGGANNGAPCTALSECPSGGCGRPGLATEPNQCDDGVCVATNSCLGGSNCSVDCTTDSECPGGTCAAGEGRCLAGPFEEFCGPNATFQGCNTNADCASVNKCVGGTNAGNACSGASACPGGSCQSKVGGTQENCIVGKFRPCFTDNGVVGGSVTAAASATSPTCDQWDVVLANTLTCVGPTLLTGFNSAVGLPGLSRFQLPARLHVYP